jgi:predicted short-subunit dehydrogenase-like oxidoreductase (DUF2520 family)
MKVVIIGSGNLATHFGLALKNKGINIIQVYSRTESNAEKLGSLLNVPYITDILEIDKNADFYFYAVNDSALTALIKKNKISNSCHVHMSGSSPMSIFKGNTSNYGVFYPLQTFSKDRPVDFNNIPIFVESSNADVQKKLTTLAKLLSEKVYNINSEQRKRLHLAAVFACNFSNFMYDCAYDVLRNSGVGFELLQPLITETADKIITMTPKQAQTGPAIRYDKVIINKHLDLLKGKKNLHLIYMILSNSINKRHKRKKIYSNIFQKIERRILGYISNFKQHI